MRYHEDSGDIRRLVCEAGAIEDAAEIHRDMQGRSPEPRRCRHRPARARSDPGTRRLAAAAGSLAPMRLLLAAREIRIEEYGKASKRMQRIVRGTPLPF